MGETAVSVDSTDPRFSHEAAFYAGPDDLASTVVPFIREGVERREPVLIAMVPEKLEVLERELGTVAFEVDFVDMSELGANPACIIPEWRRFLADTQADGPVRGVGEPIWLGRRDVELEEAALHESLLNLAFDEGPGWRLMCPYDVTALPKEIVDEAQRNHPVIHADGGNQVGYAGHDHADRLFTSPLAEPPVNARSRRFAKHDIVLVRALVQQLARQAGLSEERTDDMMLAAHELATNSVLHGGGTGELTVWSEQDALVVEIRDAGVIRDPLVGRGLLDLESENGRGIWMANQLCELVQVRSGPQGTQVRLWAWL